MNKLKILMSALGRNPIAHSDRAVRFVLVWAIAALLTVPAQGQTYGEAVPKQPPPPPYVKNLGRVYLPREVTKRAVITEQPQPGYTEQARKNNTQGTVVLRVVLTAKRSVVYYQVVSGLPDGLTEQAIEVARRIKFNPAIKDNQPVSQWAQVMYDFSLY